MIKKNNLKILFLAKYLNPSGVTTFMFNFGKRLMDYGFIVGIATGKETIKHDFSVEKFKENGFNVFEIPFPGKGYNIINNINRMYKSIDEVLKVIRYFKPDIIHVHWRVTSIFAEIAYRLYNIPYIVTIHLEGIPNNFLAKKLSFWGNYAVAISKETYDYLHNAFNIPYNRIKLIYNGVDDNYFYPPSQEDREKARKEFGLSSHDKVVCLIGRLSKVKGHDILIKAASLLKEKNIKPIYILAGIGDIDFVKSLIKENNLEDQFVLPGFVDSRDVLWASDLLVLPSRQEGFPLVVVEAMFCKVVPIRTPAAGAFDQIEDGFNGYIVPFDDYVSLADMIQFLLKNEIIRQRMAQNAYEKAKKFFTLDHMVKNYLDIYNDLIEAKR
jgi:glycosyltransferase involved in cell wall biosynthesis